MSAEGRVENQKLNQTAATRFTRKTLVHSRGYLPLGAYTVSPVRWDTYFLVNRVENQKSTKRQHWPFSRDLTLPNHIAIILPGCTGSIILGQCTQDDAGSIILGQCIQGRVALLADFLDTGSRIWSVFDQYFNSILSEFDKYLISILSRLGQYLISIWWRCDRFWPVFDQFCTSIRPVLDEYLMTC